MSSVQTMKSWAVLIESSEEVPHVFYEQFIQLIDNLPSFPYTVFVPPSRFGLKRHNAKLVCMFEQQFHIFEKVKKSVTVTSYPFESINYIEKGSVLLSSWIKINGMVDGNPVESIIEYNSVTYRLFDPILKAFRKSYIRDQQKDIRNEMEKFKFMKTANFKFMNYAYDSILPGEEVKNVVLQGDIFVKYFKYFDRILERSHVHILTDKEMIIIKDGSGDSGSNCRYGGEWLFIPLDRIKEVSFDQNTESNLFTLLYRLPENKGIKTTFSMVNKAEMESLAEELRKLKDKPLQACVQV